MSMKPSTKAKKLQARIAYFLLSNRKLPKEVIVARGWNAEKKIWHLKDKTLLIKPHCYTCQCYGSKGTVRKEIVSLCTTLRYNPGYYAYMYHTVTLGDIKSRRPCKLCLRKLSKIANTED